MRANISDHLLGNIILSIYFYKFHLLSYVISQSSMIDFYTALSLSVLLSLHNVSFSACMG